MCLTGALGSESSPFREVWAQFFRTNKVWVMRPYFGGYANLISSETKFTFRIAHLHFASPFVHWPQTGRVLVHHKAALLHSSSSSSSSSSRRRIKTCSESTTEAVDLRQNRGKKESSIIHIHPQLFDLAPQPCPCTDASHYYRISTFVHSSRYSECFTTTKERLYTSTAEWFPIAMFQELAFVGLSWSRPLALSSCQCFL